DQTHIALIEADIDELIRQTDAGCDEHEYKSLTNDISSRMYGMIQNRYIRGFIDSLRQKMLWHYCYMGISLYENRQLANKDWFALGKALSTRDEQSAQTAAHRIVAESKNYALKIIDEGLVTGKPKTS